MTQDRPLHHPRVFSIIPAAGRSRRMGSPKQLLDVGGRPMLRAVVDPLLATDVDGVLIVTHSGLEQAVRAMFTDPRVALAINDDEQSEMIDSIRLGLRAWRERESVRHHDGFLVCPCDHPGIATEDFDACIAAFRTSPDRIVVASRKGRRGHPIIVSAPVADMVDSVVCEQGLHALFMKLPDRNLNIECRSSAVTRDIDTQPDLKMLDQPTSDHPW
jgi:molybdenum cofactor cytidylyltransferase